jgi:hypothetical protein
MNARSVECKAHLCIASFDTTRVFAIGHRLPLILRGEFCCGSRGAPDNFVDEHLWNRGIRCQLQRAHDLEKVVQAYQILRNVSATTVAADVQWQYQPFRPQLG